MKFELHILLSLFMLRISHTASSQFLSSLTGGNLQFQALLSIKDQISQDPFGILASWNNSSHFCNWTGVSCNHEQQNVLGLNLSGSEFSGTLSASIGNLTFLKDLNLENNFFVGSIPQEIGQLYHFQRLVLSNNYFTGEIPRNFSYLVEISVIELDRNNLIGTIPAEIGSLSNLIELDISLNNLSGKIPSSLGNLSDLRVLSLSFNNLEGIIPPELGMLSKLQFLQVTSNNLAGPLPSLLYNITSIVEIVLTSNKLSGSLPWDFGMSLPNLRTFSVGENRFHGFIPASVCNISGLVILDISGNSLSGPIPMDLGNLKQLQRLDLGGNSLGNNVTIGLDFLTSLINCTKLKVLHLNDNNHSGILPDSIANLSVSLVSLRLDRNYISGKIPFVWKNLKNLERLALSDNSLNGAIPDSIGELNKLQGLYLSNNRFVGEIPSSIGNITLLNILEMHLNMLEGSIPTSLSNCRNLLALDLSQNRLNGVVIRQIFDLFTLTYLNLSNNLLSGSLPFEIGILRNLISFDISRNKLSGKLPYSIGAYTTLQFFSIQGNNFNSSIPSSFSSLRNIQLLDLSSNNISGQIPLNFTSFHYIHFLNLSFNVLEGEVPKKGIFMNATLFSIIGNENICGGMKSLNLPKCPSRRGKVKFSIVLILPSIGVLVLMVITYIFVFKCRPKTINVPPNPPTPLEDLYPKLSYDKLHKSTDGFSLNHLIGKGRFSSVYKGILSDGQMVAVKVINLQERGAKKSFLAECEILKNIRHRNLVKIITSCSSTDSEGNEFKALVYEFMRNGDLDSWLHPITSTEHLDQPKKLGLIQRFNIAIDVATTLVYLHHSCDFPVIHHDIKPSNILLDNELHARVGDFGSARSLLLPTDERKARTRTNTVGIIGTVGYIALEYGTGGRVSTLVDVYSYGIVLLEMFTGKRPTDSMFKHNFSLRDYVKMAIPEHVMRIADPQFLAIIAENNGASERQNNQELMNCLTSIFKIGVACSAPRTRERMEITDALMQLRKLAAMKCLQDDYLGNFDNGHCREESQNSISNKARTKIRTQSSAIRKWQPPHTQAGETSNPTDVEVEPKKIRKLFLIGLEGSGTSTIFNQAKILYGNKFSPEELQDIKLMIQRNLYKYLCVVLHGRKRFEGEILYGNKFSPEERQGIKLMLQSYLYKYWRVVLYSMKRFKEEAIRAQEHVHQSGGNSDTRNSSSSNSQCLYSLIPRLKRFSDFLLDITAAGYLDSYFPAVACECAPSVEELWKDPAIQETYRRKNELHLLPDIADYFLSRTVEISSDEYEPTETDILYAEGVVSQQNGLAYMEFELDEHSSMSKTVRYHLIRMDTRVCKLEKMFNYYHVVIFCVALSDYDQMWVPPENDINGVLQLQQQQPKNKIIQSKQLFETLIQYPSVLFNTPFVLVLNKYDLFEEKVNRVPLSTCEWFTDFSPLQTHHNHQLLAQQAYYYVAKKFKDLYESLTGRKLFVCQANARNPETIDQMFKYVREVANWDVFYYYPKDYF